MPQRAEQPRVAPYRLPKSLGTQNACGSRPMGKAAGGIYRQVNSRCCSTAAQPSPKERASPLLRSSPPPGGYVHHRSQNNTVLQFGYAGRDFIYVNSVFRLLQPTTTIEPVRESMSSSVMRLIPNCLYLSHLLRIRVYKIFNSTCKVSFTCAVVGSGVPARCSLRQAGPQKEG